MSIQLLSQVGKSYRMYVLQNQIGRTFFFRTQIGLSDVFGRAESSSDNLVTSVSPCCISDPPMNDNNFKSTLFHEKLKWTNKLIWEFHFNKVNPVYNHYVYQCIHIYIYISVIRYSLQCLHTHSDSLITATYAQHVVRARTL